MQLLATEDYARSTPRLQWQWVPNPLALHPLGDKAFHCEWPLGEPLEATEVAAVMKVGDSLQTIERGFVRTTGQLSYELVEPRGLIGKDEITMRQVPATEAFIALPSGEMLSLELPPTNSFVFV